LMAVWSLEQGDLVVENREGFRCLGTVGLK
jgi:hypothetical protein